MELVLIAMTVRVVEGLILGCVFIVGGEVAVAIWALAGWGGDLDKAPIAISHVISQETSPAEVWSQTERAVEPLGEHSLGGGGLVVKEGAVTRGEDRGDQVGNSVDAGFAKAPVGCTTRAITRPFWLYSLRDLLKWPRVAWCRARLQVDFCCLLMVLVVDFPLSLGDYCVYRAGWLCCILVVARLGLHVCESPLAPEENRSSPIEC